MLPWEADHTRLPASGPRWSCHIFKGPTAGALGAHGRAQSTVLGVKYRPPGPAGKGARVFAQLSLAHRPANVDGIGDLL